MRRLGNDYLRTGVLLIVLFGLWTVLIQTVDVQCIGETGTAVGFATLNGWFHTMTGVHMPLYMLTDWLGLVPIIVCMMFGLLGFVQLVKRKSVLKVDRDIIFLGLYYLLVIVGYFVFERLPVNYRPILIDGRIEASYPSSTTLLVASVMPTLVFQIQRRLQSKGVKRVICTVIWGFTLFTVIGRLCAGVHWFTDIVGGVLLSAGLFCLYAAAVLLWCTES